MPQQKKFNSGEFVISIHNNGPVYVVLEHLFDKKEVKIAVVIGAFKVKTSLLNNKAPDIYTADEEILSKITLKDLTKRLVNYVLEDEE